MKILGISAFYHDSAAALVLDGKIVAAAQESGCFVRCSSEFPYFPGAQRVVRVDAVDRERGRVDARAVKRLHVIAQGRSRAQFAAGRHLDEDRSQFEQCVGGRIEAAGLDVDHDRQEAAEAVPDAVAGLGCAHPVTSFQPILLPARSGTSSSAPNG